MHSGSISVQLGCNVLFCESPTATACALGESCGHRDVTGTSTPFSIKTCCNMWRRTATMRIAGEWMQCLRLFQGMARKIQQRSSSGPAADSKSPLKWMHFKCCDDVLRCAEMRCGMMRCDVLHAERPYVARAHFNLGSVLGMWETASRQSPSSNHCRFRDPTSWCVWLCQFQW